jgi:hypothetical protein
LHSGEFRIATYSIYKNSPVSITTFEGVSGIQLTTVTIIFIADIPSQDEGGKCSQEEN